LGESPFLVVNGDVFTEIDFAALSNVLQEDNLAHLVMVDNPPQHPLGDFALNDGKLVAEGEHKLTFSGVGVYSPQLFAHVIRGEPARLAPLLKAAMLDGQVTGEYFQGIWHDIGTPERLTALDLLLQSQ